MQPCAWHRVSHASVLLWSLWRLLFSLCNAPSTCLLSWTCSSSFLWVYFESRAVMKHIWAASAHCIFLGVLFSLFQLKKIWSRCLWETFRKQHTDHIAQTNSNGIVLDTDKNIYHFVTKYDITAELLSFLYISEIVYCGYRNRHTPAFSLFYFCIHYPSFPTCLVTPFPSWPLFLLLPRLLASCLMEVFPCSLQASHCHSAQVGLISCRMIISHWQQFRAG